MTTWEEAVRRLRDDPDKARMVRDNYFDLPVHGAAERYESGAEFNAILHLIGRTGRLLDVGAGNGITSFALARAGWRVTAVEPDASLEVGAGAAMRLCSDLNVSVHRAYAEHLPFSEATFDAVHGRQILHHLRDLRRGLTEVRRVLVEGGIALFTREHVVDDADQLTEFLRTHPLHAHYGGEYAYSLDEYCQAFAEARLEILHRWGPLGSPINYYPGSEARRRCARIRALARGADLGLLWDSMKRSQLMESASKQPGRLYTFLLRAA